MNNVVELIISSSARVVLVNCDKVSTSWTVDSDAFSCASRRICASRNEALKVRAASKEAEESRKIACVHTIDK